LDLKPLPLKSEQARFGSFCLRSRLSFSRFAEILEKVKKKLSEAQDTIDTATRKTRTIERKLKSVEVLSSEKDPEKILYDEEAIEEGSGK